jgi:hypothetical protein
VIAQEDAMKAMAKVVIVSLGLVAYSPLWAQDTKPATTPAAPAASPPAASAPANAAKPATPATPATPAAAVVKREAPVGHKQPRAVEVPTPTESAVRENPAVQRLEQADKRIRNLTMRGICSNC